MSSQDKALAGPPGKCCLKTVQHVGDPVGKSIKVGELDTYISYPDQAAEKSHKRILLFFPDVAGPFFVNNRLLCDFFASHGWLVLAPDYYEGDPVTKYRTIVDGKVVVDPEFDFGLWLEKHHTSALQITPPWIEATKSEFGTSDSKFATIGCCFGGPFVLDLAAGDLVSAAATAHPAYLNESHFKKSKQPMFFSCSETELPVGFVPESRHLAEKILAENKQHYHFQLFSGVDHGFACRGDPNDENQSESTVIYLECKLKGKSWAKEESANCVLRWFERFCN